MRLAPVVLELRVVASVLLASAAAASLVMAAEGSQTGAAAAVLLLAGGIYFAVVAGMRRRRLEALLGGVPPCETNGTAPFVSPTGHECIEEPRWRTVARSSLDGVAGLAFAAATALVDLAFVGLTVVFGVGAWRAWQAAQVRRWERAHERRLLREPAITRGWADPEHLVWVPRKLDTSLLVVDAPPGDRRP